MRKKIVLVLLTGTIVASTLSGCAPLLGKNVVNLPLVPELSSKEVVDYYKKALSFDTTTIRNLNVQKVTYETKPVSDAQATILKTDVTKVESGLTSMDYPSNSDVTKLLNESTFHYIKSYLNAEELTGGKVLSTTEALGFYFVDVQYTVGPRSIGNLTPQAGLLGINGAFSQDYLGNDSVDKLFVNRATSEMNKYYVANKIDRSIVFNKDVPSLTASGNQLPSIDFTVATPPGTAAPTQNRAPLIDAEEFNNIAGSSAANSAYMPKLSMVFQAPPADSNISGIGIYPSGDGGLKQFGFNRSQMKGTLTLRYVFKSDVINPSALLGVNIYPVSSEIVSGIDTNTNNVTVPDFLMTEFSELIERSDRAIADTDLTALMSGSLYTDSGMAVLTGYESQHVNLLRNMSTIRRVIARDTTHNTYLLEVETIRQEGSKGSDVYGTYRDKDYVAVAQIGNKFVITDSICMSRQMTSEPAINPDSAVTKRLVALNLAGPVTDTSKAGITELLGDLYKASTLRVLNGPKDVTVNGQKTTIARGMYDCFDSDTGMLAADKKEYINSTIRGLLVAQGVDTDATYDGVVTQWIGGASNQAELTTEEVITYKGKSTGHYMQVYYLVSNMGDKWVIDDMKVMSSEDKTGTELQQIVNRISKK